MCSTRRDGYSALPRELVEFGGAITQHLLGYRTDPDSGRGGLGFRAE